MMHDLNNYKFSKSLDNISAVGSAFKYDNPDIIPLDYGYPAPDTFLISLLSEASERALHVHGQQALQYTGGPGRWSILKWIRERSLLRAMDVREDNILITTGANQAIDLAARILTDPGDQVWAEAPTFFDALCYFHLARTQVTAFPIDEHGLRVDLIEAALLKAEQQHHPLPKFIYVMPNYQNPTGVSLSVDRRKRLAELAYDYNFYILEDDAYVELNYDGSFRPSIYSFASERVIYLSTFSKIIAPGLRMGWAIAGEDVLDRMRIAKTDGLTSVFLQEVVNNYLEKVDFSRHRQQMISCYRSRRDAMTAAITEFFGGEVTYTKPTGGFYIWVTFPQNIDTAKLLHIAMEQGISYVEGHYFFSDGRVSNQLRLSFSFCDEKKIREGVRKLAHAYFDSVKNNAITC